MQSIFYRLLTVLISFCLCGLAGAQQLLDPAVAFKFSAQALDAKTLEVRYQIAKGYYMYRDKFKFALEPASVQLGEAQLPQGDVHNDEYFGKVETYRKEVRIRLPIIYAAAEMRLKLSVTSQGCADIGVCYPPQVQTAQIALDASLPPASMASAVPDTAFRRPGRNSGRPRSAVTASEMQRRGRLWRPH